MPKNIETQVEGDVAYVRALDGSFGKLAATLLDAAGDDREQVVTVSDRPGLRFRVPLAVAERAGLVDAADADESSTPEPPVTSSETDDRTSADEPPAESSTESSTPDVEEPPRSGTGSGEKVWRAFLEKQGVEIPESATGRDDLIELWDARQS